MIVHTLKMCTDDAGPEQSLVLYAFKDTEGLVMSVHVLLNLLNKLGKRDKFRGLLSILLLICNKFIKLNHSGA